MPTNEELKTRLSELPLEERADLARYLIRSLDTGADPDAEEAWDAELARRGAEIRSGATEGVPAESVFARLRGKLR